MMRGFILIMFVSIVISCKEEKSPDATFPVGENFQKTGVINDTLIKILRVENPSPGQLISSPLKISGKARGYWFFEAEATVELIDGNLQNISETNTTTVGEWMTEDWVEFSGILTFEDPTTKTGYLVFHKANPSGLEEHAKSDTIKIIFHR